MPQDKFLADQLYSPTLEDFYPRYLAAKQGIDDRALNRQVWETLRQTLA